MIAKPITSAWIGLLFRPTLCISFTMLVGALTRAEEPAASNPLPLFPEVAETIQQHFVELKHYKRGDVISRGEAQQALDRVAKELGWEVPDRAELEKLVLSEDAYLIRQMRTKAGTRFMRRIGGLPGAYDRLDRLSVISGGHRLIEDMIGGTSGHELIEYLSTSKGGENLGRMLARTQGGSDLNKPTGRIYTAESLVKAVEKIYSDLARS